MAIKDLVRDKGIPALNDRQKAVLLTVVNEPGPHTIRGMADTLDVHKPSIVRSVDRLEAFDLVRRVRDPQDRRSVNVVKTIAGAKMAKKIAAALGVS